MKGEMEKRGRLLVIAIFFLFFIFISTAQGAWDNDDLVYAKGTSGGQMTVHNIDTAENFETIQAAIDDPDTKDGHTISVDAGNYPKPGISPKPVVINKQLKLIGENKDTTIIDGGGRRNCIKVTADNVEISGFTIKNGDYGVYLESSNCRVIDNYITSIDFDGIFLSNSVNNTIAHNSLSEVERRGIRLSSSSNNRIHDNDLSENDEGIVLFASQDNIIYHNKFIDNRNQAKDNRDTNRWDNGPKEGGNYWSDHECTGNPSDGNQPYDISSRGATDLYPFMDRDGWLAANLTVTILYPNGGESIPIGTQVQVSVHATDDTAVTNVTFFYSSNGGSNWDLIGAGMRVSGTNKDGIWHGTWNTSGLSVGSNYLIKAVASDGTLTIEDLSESTFSLSDTIPPTVTISYPTSGQTLTTTAITVNGTASDNVAVSKVEVKVGSGDWQTASGTTSWSTPVTLALGSNTIHARAADTSGNINQTSVRVFVRGESSVTISAVPSTINLSESVNISGNIIPTHSANVTLTFTTPNNATQKNSITSTPNGRYYFVFHPKEVGKWTVNATWAGDPDTAGNTSKTVPFIVIGESSVTISAVPSTINLSESVNISGNIIPTHSANVTLTFTTPNNATQKNSITSTPNGRYYFVFHPKEAGKWTVNATWAGDFDTAGNTSKTVSFTVNDKVGYAIIIAGRRDKDCGRIAIELSAKNTYTVLLNRSFTDEHIFYLNPSKGQGVDNISSSTNIKDAINTWTQNKVSANVPLLIYIVGHCKNDTFIVNGTKDNLTSSYLNNSLNNLTNETGCDNITVVCEACNSGSFIDDLSLRGRIIVSSTGVDADSKYHKEKGGVFSYYFFDSISSGVTIKDAFETASNSQEIKDYSDYLEGWGFPRQTPLLDDNGDGVGNEINSLGDDGLLAASKYIGTQGGSLNFSPALTSAIQNKNKTYNYTIRTGSYPEITHENDKDNDVLRERIAGREFTDANGYSYNNWIPAIR